MSAPEYGTSSVSELLTREVLCRIDIDSESVWCIKPTRRMKVQEGQDSQFFVKQTDTVVWRTGILEGGAGNRRTVFCSTEDEDRDQLDSPKAFDPSAPARTQVKDTGDLRSDDQVDRNNCDMDYMDRKDESKVSRLSGDVYDG